MFSIPSFLSWPFSLPQLPSISLPANIQRRFLSYVLKRYLGRFVKEGSLDVERIQSQISQGWVEIENLEVDTNAINALLPASPFGLSSGSITKVTARVPFPNLWTDPLSLSVDGLTLDFELKSPTSRGKRPQHASNSHAHANIDLAASVTSAADDFLHDEIDAYEGAELDRSIRQSILLSHNDPFTPANDGVPGSFPFSSPAGDGQSSSPLAPSVESKTALAALVERILARLTFKVKKVRVRVCIKDGTQGSTFELRIGEVSYADETAAGTALEGETVRTVRIAEVAVYVLDESKTETPISPPRKQQWPYQRSFSSSTASSSATDDNADMAMSLAVADLRQSSMATSAVSGKSIYQSAIGQTLRSSAISEGDSDDEDAQFASALDDTPIFGEAANDTTEPEKEDDVDASAPEQGEEVKAEGGPKDTLLLSFGQEDIVLQLKTTLPPSSPAASTSPSQQSPSSPVVRPGLPAMAITVTIGNISSLITPSLSIRLLSALRLISVHCATDKPARPAHIAKQYKPQPRVHAVLRIRGIYVTGIYDMQAESDAAFASSVAQFYAKPSTTFVPYGHLKLKVENIEAGYTFRGFTPRTGSFGAAASRPSAPSRQSSGVRIEPPPADITLTLSDVSVFEHLATDSAAADDDAGDQIPGGAYPVLLFDSNLLQQYDSSVTSAAPTSRPAKTTSLAASSPFFPEFESLDWRNSGLQKKTGSNEKVWKVRARPRGGLKGTRDTVPIDGPAVTVQLSSVETSPVQVKSLPIHLFFDLSLIERLLPVLRHTSKAIQAARTSSPLDSPHVGAKLGLQPARPPFVSERSSSYVIDDLDAQATSVSTIRPSKGPTVELACPLIRLDIRCPAPLARRGTWGDGAHLRSGIVTLDVHGLRISLGGHDAHDHVKRNVKTASIASVTWDRMLLFFCRTPSKKAKAICIIGPLAPDPSELIDQDPLPPVFELKKSINTITGVAASSVTCRIPNVQAKVDQTTIEGLQFFADDLTHWLDGAFGDGSAPKPRDDLKMIGSRFFGSKASSSASSSDDEVEDAKAATVLKVLVTEVDVTLHVPRVADPFAIDISTERVLGLHASDMEVKVELNTAGKQETTLNLTVMDATFADRSANADILRRTVPLSLTMNTSPILALRFTSLTNIATLTKETGISVACTTAAAFITRDLGWIKELKSFAKTPEGVFEDVVPSEVTRISLKLYDCSLHVATPTVPGELLLVLGAVDVRTEIISDADESILDVGLDQVDLLAIDDRAAAAALSTGYHKTLEAWRRAGYAPLLNFDTDIRVVRSLGSDVQSIIDVLDSKVTVTLCADSLLTLGQLVGDLSNMTPRPATSNTKAHDRPSALSETINVFASVDDEAFRRLPDLISGLDLMEDDLPNNLDYLDSTAGRRVPAADASPQEGMQSWETEHDDTAAPADAHFAAEVKGETVKVLVDGPVDLIENYWDSLPTVRQGADDEVAIGDVRIRVHQCAISVQLFDGYDWQKTRKTIEDEIKAVRKRLERIRQLLASGQKADESIEDTRSTLFNSIYIGVDQRNDMDTAALLKAIDDELDGLGDETASQSSWQTMPLPGSAEKRSKVRLRGKRLTRSKKPQIEFGLKGLRAEVDQYGAASSTATRLNVNAASFEILDHIKTSTWKKFLTEMKADSRGNVRETDADMLRLEVLTVRPNLPDPGEEIRVKAKILPLRLHVDQDALDFLKAFFGFQVPGSDPSPDVEDIVPDIHQKGAKAAEPFFQYVEIYPVELKLDYKPKRVDLAALRQGKTIELMNFFHFDGAEMTLRHVTLSGVTGVTKLSTLLQDIWTPDVKANQLADVISGVSPIRSMVNVGSGVADLILLPIEQYRKDGRVARGVQRGTNSFVRSTAMEMMKLGARLATGTQVILEKAEGVLGGKFGQDMVGEVGSGARPSLSADSDDEDAEDVDLVSRYADQPMDVRQGVQAAYRSLSKNVNEAAQTILAVPMEVYERSGDTGPLRAVVRAVPVAVLRPMIGASEAVSKTLLGARNSLDPRSKVELGDKYKRSEKHST